MRIAAPFLEFAPGWDRPQKWHAGMRIVGRHDAVDGGWLVLSQGDDDGARIRLDAHPDFAAMAGAAGADILVLAIERTRFWRRRVVALHLDVTIHRPPSAEATPWLGRFAAAPVDIAGRAGQVLAGGARSMAGAGRSLATATGKGASRTGTVLNAAARGITKGVGSGIDTAGGATRETFGHLAGVARSTGGWTARTAKGAGGFLGNAARAAADTTTAPFRATARFIERIVWIVCGSAVLIAGFYAAAVIFGQPDRDVARIVPPPASPSGMTPGTLPRSPHP